MRFFDYFKPKIEPKVCIGYVGSRTFYTNDEGECLPYQKDLGRFLLAVRGEKRSFSFVGREGRSESAVEARAEVEAWVMGGPVPSAAVIYDTEPEKPKVVFKEGNVLGFPRANKIGDD